jgi:hypothetical protein
MKLGAFTCWLSDRPLDDALIQEAAVSAFAITPTATSGRYRSLTINGAAHRSGATHWVQLGDGEPHMTIAVTSPDGTVSHTYTLAVSRAAA